MKRKKYLGFAVLAALLLAGCGSTDALIDPTPVPGSPAPTVAATAKLTREVVDMTYQPMQCEKTPWDVWMELGEVNFVNTPTAEEVIVAYYSSQGIEVFDVVKVEREGGACEACSICPIEYSFTLKTAAENVDGLKATGWK